MTLLGGVVLVKLVWPCGRTCVTVGAGFEVSGAQGMHSAAHSLLLLPLDQEVKLLAASLAPYLSAHCHVLL